MFSCVSCMLTVLVCSWSLAASKTLDVEEQISKLTEANIKFSINLYKQLISNPATENVVFSPISISTAMAMTHLGTKGETAKQIDDVFMFKNIEDGKFHSAFGELHGLMFDKASENVTIKSSNRVFANKKVGILRDYSNALTVYGAEVDKLDFSNSALSVKAINDWIKETTNAKIQNIVDEKSITPETAMMLANTVYFKGDWHSKFFERQTEKRAFYVSHYKVVETPFMFQRGQFRFGYIDSLTLEVLELPYSGKEFSMIIMLPSNFDLATVEKHLNYENLTQWLSSLKYQSVDVSLPKFKIEETLQLHEILPKMGVTDMFDKAKADLSGIFEKSKNLCVDQILHKSMIEVDETGSEAAAVTTVRIVARSANINPHFNADHPFLWAIRHVESGHLLFMGKLAKPNGPVKSIERDEL